MSKYKQMFKLMLMLSFYGDTTQEKPQPQGMEF